MAAVGLGRCLPLANQSASSAIQKSGSSCTAIILSLYIINSPSGRAPFNFFSIGDVAVSGASVCSWGCVGAGVSGSVAGASNVMSVKLGNDGISVSALSVKSKSVGNGKSSAVSIVPLLAWVVAAIVTGAGAGACWGVVVICDVSNADTGGR